MTFAIDRYYFLLSIFHPGAFSFRFPLFCSFAGEEKETVEHATTIAIDMLRFAKYVVKNYSVLRLGCKWLIAVLHVIWLLSQFLG